MTVEQNLCSFFLLRLFPLNIHPIHKRKKQFCHNYKLYIQESNGSVNIDIIVDGHLSLNGRSFFVCICLEQTFCVVRFILDWMGTSFSGNYTLFPFICNDDATSFSILRYFTSFVTSFVNHWTWTNLFCMTESLVKFSEHLMLIQLQ